jgi:hypothetical protein
MALIKIKSESMNLADDYAFTGTVTGAGGGKVLQVQSANYTSVYGTASTGYGIVITVVISPTANTSKFYIVHNNGANSGTNSTNFGHSTIVREVSGGGTTNLGGGHGSSFTINKDATGGESSVSTILDSPNTVSQLIYTVQVKSDNAGRTYYYNGISSGQAGQACLTVMEIAG